MSAGAPPRKRNRHEFAESGAGNNDRLSIARLFNDRSQAVDGNAALRNFRRRIPRRFFIAVPPRVLEDAILEQGLFSKRIIGCPVLVLEYRDKPPPSGV